jgi:predicted transcriptional regulator
MTRGENNPCGSFISFPEKFRDISETRSMTLLASQAARELNICERTLRNWGDKGLIRFGRTGGGWRLYPIEEIARLKRELDQRSARG